jgi:hypothetical protein
VAISSNTRDRIRWGTFNDWCANIPRSVVANVQSTPHTGLQGFLGGADSTHRAAQILWGRSQNERESGQGEQEGDGWGQYDSTTAHRGGSSSPSSAGSTVDDSYIGLGEGGTWNTPSNSASSSSIGKKSSRSEAERRYALETDPWTTSVTPHEVVCRGCRRPIKLDRRSRYYPGLWEKHRDRCEGVSRMREAMEPEVRRSLTERI